MKNKPWYPIAYMFCVTAFFSSILIGFANYTRERVEANEQIAFEKAVLKALPIQLEKDLSTLEIHSLFKEKISPPTKSSAGAYIYKEGNAISGYALPINGQGFWAPIKGIIGIATDKQTITGIAFYEQNETPGLGAEITTPSFRNQFVDKTISQTDKPFRMISPGKTLDNHSVYAITGATQTSIRVEKFLNGELKKWRNAML